MGLLSTVEDQAQVKAAAGCEPAASFCTTASRQQACPVGVHSALQDMLHAASCLGFAHTSLAAFPNFYLLNPSSSHMLLLCHADEQWGRSAGALQQALTTLATSRPTKRLTTHSSLAPDWRTPGTQQTQRPSTDTLAEGPADAPPYPVDLHAANGSALPADALFGIHAAEGADIAASQSCQVNASLNHVGAPAAPNNNAELFETDMGPSEQGASGQALHFAHDLLGTDAV